MVARNVRSRRWLQTCLVALLAIAATATNVVGAVDDIGACAKIADDKQRLSCYDKAAQDRQRRTETGAAEKSSSQQSIDSGVSSGPSSEEFKLQAHVSRCEESADGRYYFYLDNNEVWKQTRSYRQRYKDCNFSVTITKDWFGYKMLTNDDERAVRIKRVR